MEFKNFVTVRLLYSYSFLEGLLGCISLAIIVLIVELVLVLEVSLVDRIALKSVQSRYHPCHRSLHFHFLLK